MSTRFATKSDIPAIVELLRISLGERLMPKSEAFWRWKHIDNPFGPSPVLLAVEEGQIVGVRAFMRWEWIANGKVYRAVRAVDTATHPDYQGRGIFRKLTLALVDHCRGNGDAFVFNTPNEKSKPGYLKMGWQSVGRCRLRLRLVPAFGRKQTVDHSVYGLDRVLTNVMHKNFFEGRFPHSTTNYSLEYVKWRYAENPNVTYYAVADHPVRASFLAFFRIKPHRFGTEMRLCDVFGDRPLTSRSFHRALLAAARTFGATFITFAGQKDHFPFYSPEIGLGPEVTILPMNIERNTLTTRNWKPTLGDLEVF